MLTLSQAAKATGKSKSTLSRAIDAGRMSATRQDDNSYRIDEAELFRVYAPASATPDDASNNAQGNAPDTTTVAMLRDQIDALKAERTREREQLTARIDELSQSVQDWKTQANNGQLLLKNEQEHKTADNAVAELQKRLDAAEASREAGDIRIKQLSHQLKQAEPEKGWFGKIFA